MSQAIGLVAAYFIDRLVGDPGWLPHPVVWIGRMIGMLEKFIRKWVSSEKALKAAGVVLAMVIVGGAYLLVWGLLKLTAVYLHPWVSVGLEVWIISTTMATKGLADAGMEIYDRLKVGSLYEARRSLSMVVGRDTARLDEKEISRGAVETVAENIVDAIVSPLFYAAISGAPLAMAYRAVNTLDSMVGYKNERYLHFGWASARLDDLANYIPARMAGLILIVVCWMMKLNPRACFRVIRRDAHLHPSPNSGITESGVAGALGIQLGGTNYYQGIASERAKMGEPLRAIGADDIAKTVMLMKRVSLVSLVCCLLISIGVG
jgi:adenosylcobinamide-phosphate synthase